MGLYAYATFVVYPQHLKCWGITEDELFAQAMANEAKIKPEIMLAPESDFLYAVTKPNYYDGASLMYTTNILTDMADKFESDLYIIPSSVDEIIIVPRCFIEDSDMVQSLRDMIYSVNRDMVEYNKRLSDNLYYYDREAGKLDLAA